MSSTEMPESMRLNAVELTVERVKDLKDEEGQPVNGLASLDERTIQVSNTIRGHDQIRFFFAHELMHFWEDHAGLSLKEAQVDNLARSFLSTITDNPELLAWLTEPKPARKRLKGTPVEDTPVGHRDEP